LDQNKGRTVRIRTDIFLGSGSVARIICTHVRHGRSGSGLEVFGTLAAVPRTGSVGSRFPSHVLVSGRSLDSPVRFRTIQSSPAAVLRAPVAERPVALPPECKRELNPMIDWVFVGGLAAGIGSLALFAYAIFSTFGGGEALLAGPALQGPSGCALSPLGHVKDK